MIPALLPPFLSSASAVAGTIGITPAMAMLTAYSRTLTDEVAAYEATYTGASHKTMTDQYGLQTFGPNNLFKYSEQFENVLWVGSSSSTQTNVAVAPDGTTTADRYTFSAGTWFKYQVHETVIGNKYIISIWLKSVSGTQTIRLYGSSTDVSPDITITEDWQRVSHTFTATATGSSTVAGILRDTSSNAADFYIWGAQVERVTHETTPRAYNATTSAVYYGPRFVYAPETLEASTTSITIGSGSSYTFTTAAAHSFAVGDVVQATDNADPDNWIRGYVTGTTSTTVTLASYTFPGTDYSRPVLTNGSGTISDWSVIRSDGYLAEPASTPGNILPYSQGEFDNNTYYTKFGLTGIGAPSSTGPDGTTTGCLVTSANSTAEHYFYSVGPKSITSGANYATTFVFERGTHDFVTIRHTISAGNYAVAVFDLGSGGTSATQTSVGGTSGTIVSTSMKEYGNFIECTLVASIVSTTMYVVCDFASAATGNSFTTTGTISFTTNGTETFYVHSNQTELGSVATSYIPTAASSVARSADVATMTGANFSGWWNATEGTFVIDFSVDTGDATQIVLSAEQTSTAASGTNSTWLYGTTQVLEVRSGGTKQAEWNLSDGAGGKWAIALKANDMNVAFNGTAETADTTCTMPVSNDRLSIGSYNAGTWPTIGTISELIYFSTRESDAQLVTLTGG